ncbi:UDP binding domain-containing protein [Streptomyces sp. SL13]|uniref:UDP binding domain-containing protein n=1 Tax=Streptantibioticus silvisoli TaxID=2705255 RepID=A0AA90H2D7_9ACTN|nr:UDP binding domain-containing protein [Streptantibioticus silvisoli]MDI5963971.1 UDP binding domain-containing protein [Streptantibioticus silvisoli]MDI5970066.1 UDP binding domain-containing protein [Streptantibioticus silvisoli]
MDTDRTLQEAVRTRSAHIAVWGAGFIGLSAAEAFVAAGFPVVVIDVDRDRVAAVNAGRVPLPGFEDRVHLDPDALSSGRLTAVLSDSADWHAADVHIICVNTDRNGVPLTGPLHDVLARLVAARDGARESLVVLESTVSPSWLAESVGPAFAGDDRVHLATAPRRDWMLSPDMNVRTLPRVVGVAAERSRGLLADLYAPVTEQVHFARDWIHAALTKPVENLFRYVDLVLANQLRDAYPDLDMTEVLRLAGTKWNVPTYHPSLGIGGYCIPLSPHFAVDRSAADALPMVRSAMEWNAGYADLLAEWVMSAGPGPYGILGISYTPDVRIAEGSPGLALAAALRRRGAETLVHDPYFTADEVRTMSGGAGPLDFPGGVGTLGTLIVVTAHRAYAALPEVVRDADKPPVVIDNMGSFRSELADGPARYLEIGAQPS